MECLNMKNRKLWTIQIEDTDKQNKKFKKKEMNTLISRPSVIVPNYIQFVR